MKGPSLCAPSSKTTPHEFLISIIPLSLTCLLLSPVIVYLHKLDHISSVAVYVSFFKVSP